MITIFDKKSQQQISPSFIQMENSSLFAIFILIVVILTADLLLGVESIFA